jgi:hypothetical protein
LEHRGGLERRRADVDVGGGDPEVTSPISIASLLDSATVTFADPDNGVIASNVSGGVDVFGQLLFDSGQGQGGSNLSMGGALISSGTVELGNSAL